MKKVLIVGSNSIHCQRFISGLIAEQNYSLAIITNKIMSEFSAIHMLEIDFGLRNLQASRQIRAFIQQFKPDVVHIHQANSYAWHTLRAIEKLATKPRVLLTTWGSDVLLLPYKNKLMYKMVRYNLQHANIITTDSLFMASKISTILNGINRPIYTINFGIQNIPIASSVNQKQKLIISNRLHKSLYRIDSIIKAFAYLSNHSLIDEDYKLLIAASGEQSNHLIKLVNDFGINHRVIFSGMISYEELVGYYTQASIFVSIPESDGTASSLLEAMAYGCIPVLSNLPANLEWVLDKINGFIVPDVQQLQHQLLSAIELSQNYIEYNKLINFNYQIINKKANASLNTKSFCELYE